MSVVPFRVDVSDEVLDDLLSRLRRARFTTRSGSVFFPDHVVGTHLIHPPFPAAFDKPAHRAALADSPAGLAAWLVDKYRDWSDCGGDLRFWHEPGRGGHFMPLRGAGVARTGPDRRSTGVRPCTALYDIRVAVMID